MTTTEILMISSPIFAMVIISVMMELAIQATDKQNKKERK